MATKRRIPGFKSEREEAAWWDAHPEVITELFLKAKKRRQDQAAAVVRGGYQTSNHPYAGRRRRGCAGDCRTARCPYQTYIKSVLHQALERDRRAS